jgi:hypothetical protein
MIRFRSYLLEYVEPEMYDKLAKIGYTKVKQGLTKNILLVYVPKSERESALADISDKLNAPISDDRKAKNISSLGAALLPNGTYIAVKPDTDKSLTTDEQESLAGLHIATMLANPTTDFSYADLVKYGDPLLHSKYYAKDMYEKASKTWLKSSMTIAKTIYPHIRGKKFQVHQRSNSAFVNSISAAAQKLVKASGISARLDKWNPSDVWLVHPSLVATTFSQFTSVNELNSWLMENFEKKLIIGVSLKAVGATAKVQEFNTSAPSSRGIEFNSYDLGKSGFVSAMDMNIFFNDGSLNIRAFGRPQNVSADISGKKARGGKVGSGALFSIVRKYAPTFSTPADREIASKFAKDPNAVTAALYEKMNKLTPGEASKMPYRSFHDEVVSKSNALTYVISKTQVCDIAIAIEKMSKRDKDNMLEELFDYAASSLSISSVFLKVS